MIYCPGLHEANGGLMCRVLKSEGKRFMRYGAAPPAGVRFFFVSIT